MVRTHISRLVGFAFRPWFVAPAAAIAISLIVTISQGWSQVPATTGPSAQSMPATTTSTAATQPTTAPAAVVGAKDSVAMVDIGRTHVGKVHTVVYGIENARDKAVDIKQTRGDCECITAVNPPAELKAKATTLITARFEVPNVKDVYGSELLVITNDSTRRIIRLRILCNVVP